MSNQFKQMNEKRECDWAEIRLKQFIKGTIPLTSEELERDLQSLCSEPMVVMNFLHTMSGMMKTTKLTDEDRDKLHRACCTADEPSFWFLRLYPDSYLREKAFDSICGNTRTSMQFRMEKMHINDGEKHISTKMAIRHYGNVSAFIQGPYDLDSFEKGWMIDAILEHGDLGMAANLYKGYYDFHCKFTLAEKERVMPLLLSDILVKGENRL